MSTYVDTQSVL